MGEGLAVRFFFLRFFFGWGVICGEVGLMFGDALCSKAKVLLCRKFKDLLRLYTREIQGSMHLKFQGSIMDL